MLVSTGVAIRCNSVAQVYYATRALLSSFFKCKPMSLSKEETMISTIVFSEKKTMVFTERSFKESEAAYKPVHQSHLLQPQRLKLYETFYI